MRAAIRRISLAAIAVLVCGAALAQAAEAATTPTMSLDQSAGHAAGSTANLGLDLKFANTGTDSPQHLTINLPPGLLANASIDGGACLKTADVSGSACKVGSGTVTATPDLLGLLNVPASVSVPVAFYLVPPPAAGDLAGLAVELAVPGLSEQLGSTGEIKVRPTGDPAGVGVRLDLVLPDQLTLPVLGVNATQISLTEINSTFDALRYPAACPSTPARVSTAVDSYSDPTVHVVTAPLQVTGCSSLSYSPAFHVKAVRDRNDRQVNLTTEITQGPTEAPSRSVTLGFPAATLAPNLASIQALCLNLAAGTCTPVGSVRASSPLYPVPLTGKAYLTGSSTGLSLTLVFPSPFPLTLTGAVDLTKNSATFTGLPDIPLTDLAVSLNGGTDGLFLATCAPASGTATATLTDQNGDRTRIVPSDFAVQGCSGSAAGSGQSGAGAAGTSATVGNTKLSGAGWSGLAAGQPHLSFKLSVAKRAPKLTTLVIRLPAGLSFVRHRVGKRLRVTGVTLAGARIKSLSLSRGALVIRLRKAVASLTVRLGPAALHESAALKARAGRLQSLRLVVVAENTKGRRTTINVPITKL